MRYIIAQADSQVEAAFEITGLFEGAHVESNMRELCGQAARGRRDDPLDSQSRRSKAYHAKRCIARRHRCRHRAVHKLQGKCKILQEAMPGLSHGNGPRCTVEKAVSDAAFEGPNGMTYAGCRQTQLLGSCAEAAGLGNRDESASFSIFSRSQAPSHCSASLMNVMPGISLMPNPLRS
ncbi:hypothetical protein QP045_09950 [Sphingomonas sp. 3-13AW]